MGRVTLAHRTGYRVKDPARPCYTCGAAPVGVTAGQPYYPATCRHEPIAPDPATLDFGNYAPVRVILTDDELRRATDHAKDAIGAAERHGMAMKFDPVGGETELSVKTRGYAAEVAAQRVTGLPLHWTLLGRTYRRRDKPSDLGQRTEVRNARRLDGRLVAYVGERIDWLYLLVVGEARRYIVVGFMEGRELIVPQRKREPPRVQVEGYWASQKDLHPIAELPEDA